MIAFDKKTKARQKLPVLGGLRSEERLVLEARIDSKLIPRWKMRLPIGSMYGIFTYIYHKFEPNVGESTIHGSYGVHIKQTNYTVSLMNFWSPPNLGFPRCFRKLVQ